MLTLLFLVAALLCEHYRNVGRGCGTSKPLVIMEEGPALSDQLPRSFIQITQDSTREFYKACMQHLGRLGCSCMVVIFNSSDTSVLENFKLSGLSYYDQSQSYLFLKRYAYHGQESFQYLLGGDRFISTTKLQELVDLHLRSKNRVWVHLQGQKQVCFCEED